MRTKIAGLAVTIALLMASTGHAAGAWCNAGEFGGFHVVVSDVASPTEKYAAREFAAYWQRCTGEDAAISNAPAEGAINVWVGSAPAPLTKGIKLGGLGDDGVIVWTTTAKDGTKDLLLLGGKTRGTLYAVYQFFEDYMGVRWLTPELTHVPAAPSSLPEMRFRFVPPLPYRDTNYRPFVQNPYFASVGRLNGFSAHLTPEMGGNISYVQDMFGHTLLSYVEPDKYFDTHPEYFSLVDGKRMKKGQLCLTNPDVFRIVSDEVKRKLRAAPKNERIVSLTQMDWPFWCTCPQCKAIDDREGSQAGTMVYFANKVADEIKDEFSDAYIDIFAYTYTRKTPEHIKPRDNVIVRLCSIECDFSRPLSDRTSRLNRPFQQDIQAWHRITKNLFIWDYTQNWYSFQGPEPNFHVLQPNIKFFTDNGVAGVFEQASPSSPHSFFEYMKSYIIAHALWNPDDDWKARYDEFLNLYYGEVAPFVDEYIQLITNKVLDDKYELTFDSKMDWMDYDTVLKAQDIFKRAFSATRNDAIRERLDDAYLSVQYAALVCQPRMQVTDKSYILTRPPSQTFDEYWDMLMRYGVTYNDDQPIAAFKKRLNGITPLRHQEIPIEKLSNDAYEVWVLPEFGGAVVRWQDKKTGTELLRGYEAPFKGRWVWQEWYVMDADRPEIETPVDGKYAIVERTANSVTLETKLDNGLLIRRTMALEPGSGPLQVTMEAKNTNEKATAFRVKEHPEFYSPGAKTPEMFVQANGAWTQKTIDTTAGGVSGLAWVDPAGLTAWGTYLPKAKVTIVSRPQPSDIGQLFLFFNTANEHVNLEIVPKMGVLAPGETRTVKTSFETIKGRPSK